MGLCITRDGKGLPQGSRKLVMISRTVQLGLEPTSQALARLEARPWMFF
jgi:hypothetical protein